MRRIRFILFGKEHELVLDEKKLQQACEEQNIDPDHTTGLFVVDNRTLYISPHQEPEDVIQTLIHEVLHAIGHITGHIQLTHSTRKNEAFINTIAHGIVDLLKNREIFLLIGTLLDHLVWRGENEKD